MVIIMNLQTKEELLVLLERAAVIAQLDPEELARALRSMAAARLTRTRS
jgi:hypothetical protein